jgi:hypothetical protein
MKTQKNWIVIALTALALNACKEDGDINPKEEIGKLTSCGEANVSRLNLKKARTKGEIFYTVKAGDWQDPTVWGGNQVPYSGIGAVIISHPVEYKGAVGEDAIFYGSIEVQENGGLEIRTLNSFTVSGDVSVSSYLSSDGDFRQIGGTLSVIGGAILSSRKSITLSHSTYGTVEGILEAQKDLNINVYANITFKPSARVFVRDDLKMESGSTLTNRVFSDCSEFQFTVGDTTIVGTPDVTINGSGSIYLGSLRGKPESDADESGLTEIYSRVYGGFAGVSSSQVTSTLAGGPILLSQPDTRPGHTTHTSCPSNPLSVSLVSWEGKYLGNSKIELTWKTSSETDNKEFRIYQVNPCQDLKTDMKVIRTVKPNAKGEYSEIIEATKLGTYYFQLEDAEHSDKAHKHSIIHVNVTK